MNIQAFVGIPIVLVGVLMLSGCSLGSGLQSGTTANVAVLKSTDSGATFEPKNKVNEQQVVGAEVLSLLIDRSDANHIYIGTRNDGIYVTTNAGEAWTKLDYLPIKVYGLVQDPFSSNTVYATGEWQKRGKIYRSDKSGESGSWKEIYTEPADGTVVTALAQDPMRSGALVAGLSSGVAIRSDDGGATWSNVGKVEGPITQIIFDALQVDRAYMVLQGKGVLRSIDGGRTFTPLAVRPPTPKEDPATGMAALVQAPTVTTLALDPKTGGAVYVGTEKDGLWKSADGGDTWQALSVLGSSRELPVRAVSVSPFNTSEIMYSGAKAVYKSTDGGTKWSTYQLETASLVGTIQYDATRQGVIYLGFRTF